MQNSSNSIDQILMPYANDRQRQLGEKSLSFVHYTSALVALSIIQKQEIWMRNARLMNDYSELEYGANLVLSAMGGDPGRRLLDLIDDIKPKLRLPLSVALGVSLAAMQQDTFITCLSEHEQYEDIHGRLSMWRAYGNQNGVALVLNAQAVLYDDFQSSVQMSPVLYADQAEFNKHFHSVVGQMEENKDTIGQMSDDEILKSIQAVLRFATLATKHPGFAEEREWRAFFSPHFERYSPPPASIEVVNGIPQIVYKISLKYLAKSPSVNGFARVLRAVILGPSDFPKEMGAAFVRALGEAGIKNPENVVRHSGIPLRR